MCRPIRANESAALRYAARLTLGGELPARPRWCDQISTPAENQLYPYSEHSCAHRHSHDFGKLFGDSSNHRKPGVVMSIIPLDVQRRCERRWAARFSGVSQGQHRLEGQQQHQQLTAPRKRKKNPPAKPAAICESRRPDNLLSWNFRGPATRSLVMGSNPAWRQWTHRLNQRVRDNDDNFGARICPTLAGVHSNPRL